VSPLGPPRPNGPLVAPVFIDGHDEDTAPDAGPLTTEHEPTHAHDAGEASDAGGVDEGADEDGDDDAAETAGASGVLGLSDDEEREYAQDYALTER